MRIRTLCYTALTLVSLVIVSACSDATGPDTVVNDYLPAFQNQSMVITPNTSWNWGNQLYLNVPVGVDPLFDITVEDLTQNSPGLVVKYYRTPDQTVECNVNCTHTAWIVTAAVQAQSLGTARVTFTLRSDPRLKFTFIVESIANNCLNCKGVAGLRIVETSPDEFRVLQN